MGPNIFWRPHIFGGPKIWFGIYLFDICEGIMELCLGRKEDSEGRLDANLGDLLSLFVYPII